MADYNSAYTGAQIDANLALAATATQPGDLGTAAFTASTAYATAAQGTLAASAVQPADDAADLGSGAATDGYVLTADGAGGAAWEAAAGGGGTPGGTDTQVQFNDGGAFGGDSGFTFDKTNNTLGLGGGTITASDPIIDMAQTWNNAAVAFTAIKANVTDTASAAGSMLMDLQVAGASKFKVDKAGSIFINSAGANGSITGGFATTIITLGTNAFTFNPNSGSGVQQMNMGMGGIVVSPTQSYSFGSANFAVNPDVFLLRDAANTLAQRNGVNAQAFNLYNTYTDASNYERFSMKWDGNVFKFGNDNAGTGSAFRNIEFYRAGSKMITLTAQVVSIDGGALHLTSPFTPWLVIPEDSSGPTGTANQAIIFAEDNGSGKTRLMAKFGTGAAVEIAIEP